MASTLERRDADGLLIGPDVGVLAAVVGVRRWLLGTLLAGEICGSAANSITMAVGSIAAADITGTNTWVGLPTALGLLGAALASLPLSNLMARRGRRLGLVVGYGCGVLGAVLSIAAVLTRSFPMLLMGMGLFGAGNASNLLARYAAADVSPGARRGRAISLVVWGAAAGSIIGPNLLGPASQSADLIALPAVGSPFLIAIGGFGLGALLIALLLRPDPLDVARRLQRAGTARGSVGPARPLREILRQPAVRLALAALMMSNLVMIGTTSIAPVYLHDHGHPFGTIGLAVSVHLAGMYAVSPLTGWLADRFGRLAVIVAGSLVLLAAVALGGLAPAGDGPLVMLALFLNGTGWNFGFVAGSALLTDLLAPSEQPAIQGLADLFIGLFGALGSACGGVILQAWGFPVLNVLGAVLVLGPLGVTLLRRELLDPRGRALASSL